jgi:oxygen-dependent protoporphyrinogen oxidase
MKTDDELRSIVMKEIADTLAQSGEADLLKIHRYRYAIPQYDLSTGERLEAIRKIQQLHPGLIMAGNIRDGIGMADRIRQAREISQMLI